MTLRLVDLDLARALYLNALNAVNSVIGLKLDGGNPQSTSPLLRVPVLPIQPQLLYRG